MKTSYKNNYFSDGLRWTFVIASIGLSIYLILYTDYAWVISILAIATLVMFSTQDAMNVDTDNNEIVDAFSILGLNIRREKINYQALECIRVKEKKHSYTANSRSRVRQVNYTEYIGAIQYDGDKSIEVARGTDFDSFSGEISRIANDLNLNIEK